MRVPRGATLVLIAAACGGASSHPFAARRFDPVNACVGTIQNLEDIDGTEPGAICDPVCLLGPPDGSDTPIYVTTECPPFPRTYDSTGTAPDCARAIDVFKAGTACARDAGADVAPDTSVPDSAPPIDAPSDAPADTGAPGDAGEAG